ncbi:hypothetical protein PIB30_004077 [Stylosanthes scabra]|uniref:Uncharacterized protein n=1 Tax=Stylosanthes scabra TaxID=79078 RepID=A0ABU6Z1B2_9FABA|nr:hypothetical protein [Stylosanthes scabra]
MLGKSLVSGLYQGRHWEIPGALQNRVNALRNVGCHVTKPRTTNRKRLQNRYTAKHGELNPKDPAWHEAVTRLSGSSEHLDWDGSISPN